MIEQGRGGGTNIYVCILSPVTLTCYSPADAVHIVLGPVDSSREVVVDDHLDVLDIQASCGYVSGYKHVELRLLELVHYL